MAVRIYPNWVTGPGAVALLILRVVVGVAFAFHGWGKVQNPQHWMDQMPNPPPAALQAAAAFSEFGGGIALAVGFLTPLAALAIIGVMVGALAMVHIPHHDPFVATRGGPSAEPAAFYLAAALVFLFVGPGSCSLDGMLFRKRPPIYQTPPLTR